MDRHGRQLLPSWSRSIYGNPWATLVIHFLKGYISSWRSSWNREKILSYGWIAFCTCVFHAVPITRCRPLGTVWRRTKARTTKLLWIKFRTGFARRGEVPVWSGYYRRWWRSQASSGNNNAEPVEEHRSSSPSETIARQWPERYSGWSEGLPIYVIKIACSLFPEFTFHHLGAALRSLERKNTLNSSAGFNTKARSEAKAWSTSQVCYQIGPFVFG